MNEAEVVLARRRLLDERQGHVHAAFVMDHRLARCRPDLEEREEIRDTQGELDHRFEPDLEGRGEIRGELGHRLRPIWKKVKKFYDKIGTLGVNWVIGLDQSGRK